MRTVLVLILLSAQVKIAASLAARGIELQAALQVELKKKTPESLATCWNQVSELNGKFGLAFRKADPYNTKVAASGTPHPTGCPAATSLNNCYNADGGRGSNIYTVLVCKCLGSANTWLKSIYAARNDEVPNDCALASIDAAIKNNDELTDKWMQTWYAARASLPASMGTNPFVDTGSAGDADAAIWKAKWMSWGSSSAKGDPHVTNMGGEKFDILKSGTRVMVQYPRESSSDPSLVVLANIVRADAKWCENTFIEKVQVQGSMLGSSVSFTMGKLRSPGPFRVTIGERSIGLSEVVKEKRIPLPTHGSYISGAGKQMTLALAQGVSIQVTLVKHSHFQFLNLDISGLSNLPGEIGGLLGIDDHSGEASDNCKWKTHKTSTLTHADDELADDYSSLITAA